MYSLTGSCGQEQGARQASKEISKISFCLVVFFFFFFFALELASFIYQFTIIFSFLHVQQANL